MAGEGRSGKGIEWVLLKGYMTDKLHMILGIRYHGLGCRIWSLGFGGQGCSIWGLGELDTVILNALHDPKNLVPCELWYNSIPESCRSFFVSTVGC